MLARLLDRLLRCSHANYTFPITLKSCSIPRGQSPKGTYVVCLDCGKELPYDWAGMKVSTVPSARTWRGLPQSIAS